MAPLVSATKVSKIFGLVTLFEGLSLAVEEHERIAIIGSNGSGKSTFLRILAKVEEPDDGTVSWRKHLRLSYVQQEDAFPADANAYEVLRAALPEHDPDAERKVGQALGLIGFRDKSQPVAKMSGGEKKRLAIARGVIVEPEILLLDEPTNHLDIAGVRWLEELLRGASFATIFVSHDRYFIQNVAERVAEIDRRYSGGYFAVKGAYSEFLDVRATYIEQMEQYRASLANRVRREVEWLRQGAKARTTKQKARSDQAKELVAELQGVTRIDQRASMEFAASQRKSKELLKIDKLTKKFGDRVLFSDISLILSPGSRLGVVGLNGSGKTTFLRTLLGELEPDGGRVVRASKLKIALLDQLRSGLNREVTLQEMLCGNDGDAVVFNGEEIHVAGWARRFLFQTEQLAVPVKKLSGGEQARALLARIMVEPADLLILDEPTNDLDISTLEVLEDALIEFPGAVVIVTHDRYLLDRVCQVVLGLSGGRSGLFADYVQWERDLDAAPSKGVLSADKGDTRSKGPAKKLGYIEQREFEGMESKILACEKSIKESEALVNSEEAATDAGKLQEYCAALAAQQSELEKLYERWAELDEKRRKITSGE
ncbi:MAG: ABC-F family ATP-binding cassette domain-containing protein [Deltaproteobacteria bacterium]|nr:ABC-F family ATP-binding cassette domain-containing protein [Deltaproteobacteria bacterium]